MGKRFASFYRCLAFARFWKGKFFEDYSLNVNISMTVGRIFTKIGPIYLYIFIFVENRKNSGLTLMMTPVTRT